MTKLERACISTILFSVTFIIVTLSNFNVFLFVGSLACKVDSV